MIKVIAVCSSPLQAFKINSTGAHTIVICLLHSLANNNRMGTGDAISKQALGTSSSSKKFFLSGILGESDIEHNKIEPGNIKRESYSESVIPLHDNYDDSYMYI